MRQPLLRPEFSVTRFVDTSVRANSKVRVSFNVQSPVRIVDKVTQRTNLKPSTHFYHLTTVLMSELWNLTLPRWLVANWIRGRRAERRRSFISHVFPFFIRAGGKRLPAADAGRKVSNRQQLLPVSSDSPKFIARSFYNEAVSPSAKGALFCCCSRGNYPKRGAIRVPRAVLARSE